MADEPIERICKLWDKLSETVVHGIKSGKEELLRTSKMGKIRLEITGIKNRMGSKQKELGDEVYKLWLAKKVNIAELEGIFTELKQLDDEVKEKEGEIERLTEEKEREKESKESKKEKTKKAENEEVVEEKKKAPAKPKKTVKTVKKEDKPEKEEKKEEKEEEEKPNT